MIKELLHYDLSRTDKNLLASLAMRFQCFSFPFSPHLNDDGLVMTIQEIEEVDTDDHYRPKTPVQINEVTLRHKT